MNVLGHVRFWLAIIVAMFFISPLYRSTGDMRSFVKAEVEVTRAVFGDEAGDRLIQKAARAISTMRGTKHDPHYKNVKDPLDTKVSKIGNKYERQIWDNVYILLIRFYVALTWAWVLAPVLAAAVFDGVNARAIKAHDFGSIRPAAFSIAGLIVVPLCMAPLAYLISPFAISPLSFPIWTLVLAIPLSWFIANSQPIFLSR